MRTWSGLGHPDLSAGQPGGETGEEVVARLGTREPRDRRHDREGVGGQEDHVRRMSRTLRRKRVRDLRQYVGRARVLGLCVAVQVEHSMLVDDDVLEQRPDTPPVLVLSDQPALGISRQCRLLPPWVVENLRSRTRVTAQLEPLRDKTV